MRLLHTPRKPSNIFPENEQIVRSIVTSTIGSYSLRFVGEYTQAVEALEATRRTAREAGNHYLELRRADDAIRRGLLSRPTASVVQFRPGGAAVVHAVQRANAAVGKLGAQRIGSTFIMSGTIWRPPKSIPALAVDLGPKWGDPIDMTHTFLLLSHIKIAEKRFNRRSTCVRERGRSHPVSHVVTRSGQLREGREDARYLFKQGDLEAVVRWAQDSGISATDEISLYRTNQYQTWARVYLATEKYEEALQLLIRLQERVEAAGRTRSLIQTLVLRALAHQAMNDTSPGAERAETGPHPDPT